MLLWNLTLTVDAHHGILSKALQIANCSKQVHTFYLELPSRKPIPFQENKLASG